MGEPVRQSAAEAVEAFLRAHAAGLYPGGPGDPHAQLPDAPSLPDVPIKQPKTRTRKSETLLVDMVRAADEWVSECLTDKRPVVANVATIVGVDERRQLPSNAAFARVRHVLDLAHAAVDLNMVPTGDALQKMLFATAARPPFVACASAVTSMPATLAVFATIMQKYLALAPAGMVRLTAPYFLLAGEWRVDFAGQSGIALVLKQQLAERDTSTLPEGEVLALSALMSLPDYKRPQFLYAGYTLIDLALVSAAAGVPDIIPM